MEPTVILLLIIIACIITANILIFCLYLRPKIKHQEQLNKDILEKNNAAKEELETKVKQLIEIQTSLDLLRSQKNVVDGELAMSEQRMKSAKEAADNFYDTNMKLVEERFDRAAEALAAKYQQAEEDYRQTYQEMLSDSTQMYASQIQAKKNQIADLDEVLNEYQEKVAAAVENNKREEEKRTQEEFYKLQLSDEDIQEISKLREILPYLRQKEPLNKVIYKVYYEKPYTDLVGRVIGSGTHTGIYKITNSKNGMCYVGQAVDLADRWKTHVRRGVGADPPGRNKLYPAMLAFGIENFTFEVVEECQAKDLNEREQFWQDYFKAKEFGYSIR